MVRRTILVALTAVVVAAPAAQAGTLVVSHQPGQDRFGYSETIPGERNALVVRRSGDELTISDRSGYFKLVAVDAESEGLCHVVGQAAECTGAEAPRVFADLGTNADSFEIEGAGVSAVAHGGQGKDTLRAVDTTFGVEFWGDAGDDVLTGGPGMDELYGGQGADRMSGGDGMDTVDFTDTAVETRTTGQDLTGVLPEDPISARAGGVTVTLDGLANDGSPGERDLVGGDIEIVRGTPEADLIVGGTANDILYGDAGNDIMRGGEGDDGLRGESGDDDLEGQGGDDFLQGDEGDDLLRAQDGAGDSVFCGVGAADEARVDPIDYFFSMGPEGHGCEAIIGL